MDLRIQQEAETGGSCFEFVRSRREPVDWSQVPKVVSGCLCRKTGRMFFLPYYGFCMSFGRGNLP